MTVRCGGDEFNAAPGSFVFLPRGRPHRFWSTHRPARLLLIAVPGRIEAYFREALREPARIAAVTSGRGIPSAISNEGVQARMFGAV